MEVDELLHVFQKKIYIEVYREFYSAINVQLFGSSNYLS